MVCTLLSVILENSISVYNHLQINQNKGSITFQTPKINQNNGCIMQIEDMDLSFHFTHQLNAIKQHINHLHHIITKPPLCMAIKLNPQISIIAMNVSNVKIIEIKIFSNNAINQCHKNQH